MFVKQLTWLSEEAKEAELIISDGKYDCVAFSHPCNIKQGDTLNKPLDANGVEDLMLSYETDLSIKLTKPEGLAQRFVCEVVDLQHGLVKIGDIYILLNSKIPIGIRVGDLVEFYCDRIDVNIYV